MGRKSTAYEAEKRRAKVARYVARNYSYTEIAPLVDVSPSQVYKDYKKWREQRVARLRRDHDAAFVETLNGYDEAIRAAWDGIINSKADPSDRSSLIGQIGKLVEKKARLMGLIGGVEGSNTTNVLAIIHPEAAEEMKKVMSPEQAAQIEEAVIEGTYKELPMNEDADSE